jgi:Fe-S-cluster containining protein
MSGIDIREFTKKAQSQFEENEKFFKWLKSKKPKDLDHQVRTFHEEVFENIDCLDCANCCKTTSPSFYHKDIERIAKAMKIKPSQFIDSYLKLDQDDEVYMLKQEPCPFLSGDNTCMHYPARPLACKEYPHTDRKRFHQLISISLHNTLICPAVFEITNKLKKHYI